MRLLTWNCCRGPRERKLAALDALPAEVAVIQECPRPDAESPQSLWFGDNPRQGISVVATGPYRLRALRAPPGVPAFMFPVEVTGPVTFQLLAVWAKVSPGFRYVEAVVRGVELYQDLILKAPTVVIGDFNSNRIWDAEHTAERNHSALVRRLAALEMESAYHAYFREEHGAESQSTFHLHRKRDRPYHIDFCFAPRSWLTALESVEIGSFDTWASVSDHLPMRLTFRLSDGTR